MCSIMKWKGKKFSVTNKIRNMIYVMIYYIYLYYVIYKVRKIWDKFTWLLVEWIISYGITDCIGNFDNVFLRLQTSHNSLIHVTLKNDPKFHTKQI